MSCFCDKDCPNGTCGRLFASIDAPKKCCPTIDATHCGPEIGICCKSSALTGQPCNDDDICQTGLCIHGTCQEKQALNAPCGNKDEPVDNHCQSRKCGCNGVLGDALYVCCSSTVDIHGIGYVCTDLPVGAVCDESFMCDSGVCNGICVDNITWRNYNDSVNNMNMSVSTSSILSSSVMSASKRSITFNPSSLAFPIALVILIHLKS